MFDDFQDMDEVEQGFASSYESDEALGEPEGLVEPRHSNFFVGHESAQERLLSLINSGAMPHAMIFSGTQGIGKSTLAFRLARTLLKHGTPDSNQDNLFGDAAPAEITSLSVLPDDPVFSKVAAGGHPDLLTIEPLEGKKSLDVNTARKVAPFLRMTSADGGWRVVIVDDADTMNRNAQNAMLKILEEPPKNALLILVCHRLGAMIPTIRSRCRVLHFDPLNEAEFEAMMTRQMGTAHSDEDKNIIKFLSEGSVRQAQKLTDDNGLDMARKVLEQLNAWPRFNMVDIHHLADMAGRAGKETNFEHIENTINKIFECLVFAKARGISNLPLPLQHEVFTTMLNHYSLEAMVEICDKLKQHFMQSRFANLDKRHAVLSAFNMMMEK